MEELKKEHKDLYTYEEFVTDAIEREKQGYEIGYYLELKKDPYFDIDLLNDNNYTFFKELDIDAFEKINEEIDDCLRDNITWISFEYDYLEKISSTTQEADRLGYITQKYDEGIFKNTSFDDSTLTILENLREPKGSNPNENEVFLDINYVNMTQKIQEKVLNAGFEIEAWGSTAKNQDPYVSLNSFEWSGITTDYSPADIKKATEKDDVSAKN